MSNVVFEYHNRPASGPQLPCTLLVDGKRVMARTVSIIQRPQYPSPEFLAPVFYELRAEECRILQTAESPAQDTAENGAIRLTWRDVKVTGLAPGDIDGIPVWLVSRGIETRT